VSSGWSAPREHGAHNSLDIPIPVGTGVRAVADGHVIHVQPTPRGDAGIWIALRHPSGLVSRYLHLSQALVATGTSVRRGDVIARSGNTGHSSGPHLHFDLRAPRSMLPSIARAVGQPRTGWGRELAPYGIAIPAEPWIPVDGYAASVARDADDARIPLRVRAAPPPPLVADTDAQPVSTPSQVEA
jgi:murein DD-endopeptidase MepM/ murein hydrolase activator NlpD